MLKYELKDGNKEDLLRLGNHCDQQKFYLDIPALGSIPLTKRVFITLDKNVFTLEHDDEFEKEFFPCRVVFSFHTDFQVTTVLNVL